MGQDYTINIKQKGMGGAAGPKAAGKSASSGLEKEVAKTREKAVQASKKDAGKGLTSDVLKKLVDSNLRLEKAIQKLIQSNTSLAKSGGGGGSAGKAIAGGAVGGGIGGVLSMIPGIGQAAADAVKWGIGKVSEIGHAYMAETGKQLKTVGGGGFRLGSGIFHGEERSAGMKAYGMKTGVFNNKRESTINRTAEDMAAIHGLSLEETMGQAGVFASVGHEGAYQKSAEIATGAGIQSEMPLFLSSLADTLETAVKEGVNGSNMAERMGEEISSLVKLTGTNNVAAALRLSKTFSGAKENVGKGQVGSLEDMLGWKASASNVEEQMNDQSMLPGGKKSKAQAFMEKHVGLGTMTQEEMDRYTAMQAGGTKITMQDIEKVSGGYGSSLIQENADQMTDTEMSTGIVKGMGKLDPRLKANMLGKKTRDIYKLDRMNERDPNLVDRKQGALEIKNQYAGVAGSSPAKGTGLEIKLQNMVMKYGEQFADATVLMESAMMNAAEVAIPSLIGAVKGLTAAAIEAAKFLSGGKSKVPLGDFEKRNGKYYDSTGAEVKTATSVRG